MAAVKWIYVMTMVMCIAPCGSCPSSCTCKDYTRTMTCPSVTQQSLKIIQSQIPYETMNLKMESNSLFTLSEEDFSDVTARIYELYITTGSLEQINDGTFTRFSTLRTLSLSGNKIRSISNNAFQGLGSLQILDLSSNQLQTFDNREIFKPLRLLSDLKLNHNQISNIPAGILSVQTSLDELNLENNPIRNLRGTSFRGLPGLRTLLLGHCSVSTIENDFFGQISSISTLDLSDNKLTTLPKNGQMQLMRSLRNLTLQNNQLTTLLDEQFQQLNLDTLDLSHNMITVVNPNAFSRLNVRYLTLSANRIAHLPENVFQPISTQVYSLKLSANPQLTSLPDNIFQGMRTVQELDISYCAIQSLSNSHFQSLYSLQRIDISHNKLTSLPRAFMERANFMKKVELDQNAWHCDCLIKPFRDWLMSPQSNRVMRCYQNFNPAQAHQNTCQSPQCSTPSNLAFNSIKNLQDSDVTSCGKTGSSTALASTEVIIGVVAGIIGVAIIIIVLVCCLYQKHKLGEPLLCIEENEKKQRKNKKESKHDVYFREKKEARAIDPDVGSLNESDKSFIVRNYFHSMSPDPDNDNDTLATQSMTRKGSQESLSQSGYGYGSRHGSRHSSQYSLNTGGGGYRIESAV